MPTLNVATRKMIRTKAAQDLSARREVWPLTKPEFQDTVDAIDDWIDSVTASFNRALPLLARTSLTAKQKAWLLAGVIEARWRVQ